MAAKAWPLSQKTVIAGRPRAFSKHKTCSARTCYGLPRTLPTKWIPTKTSGKNSWSLSETTNLITKPSVASKRASRQTWDAWRRIRDRKLPSKMRLIRTTRWLPTLINGRWIRQHPSRRIKTANILGQCRESKKIENTEKLQDHKLQSQKARREPRLLSLQTLRL